MNAAITARRAHRVPRPRILALLGAALLALASLALQVPAAQAHDELLKTDPADGATLQKAPEEMTMTFSGNISSIGNRVVVTDSHGKNVAQGDPEVQGTTLTQKLTGGSQDESYTVTWRVVSEDGHPVQGKTSFTVGQGGSGQSSAPASAPASSASSEQGSTTEDGGSADSTTSETQDSDGLPLWAVALIGAALALAVLGVLGIVLGRSRQAKQDARDARTTENDATKEN